ncbi:MAG: UDP-glucose/GDP-mannose dehydrogenase family protein [Acidobacteria bacterium]|nr:UDP-glucose/GDP-mannose dehydrogenase family protein [Acidobacteriota bacterium]
MKLSIVGLGKLGAPMAAVMAHKGHLVTGLDLNPAFVRAIQEGRAPVNEPGLTEMIQANRDRLSATMDYEEAVLASDVTFIIVPTPSGPDGTFSMRHVLRAAEKIGAALRRKQGWHLVVLSSTVMPGSTGGVLAPALEASSCKKCGSDFGLCYNPEFIALGSVLHDMLNPDMILIGESDQRSGELLERLYGGVCESDPRIQRMNYVNAEMTKISVNTFVTTKISYANMLAEVCETLPGADADVVTAALGCDTRIGPKYLKGALGYGGPCFPRDNVAFSALAQANGVPALLAEATDQLNRRQVPRLAELILSRLPDGGIVGLLGLAYKPNTEVIDESQGVALARHLLSLGTRVVVYDPAAMENARAVLAGPVTFAVSATDCIRQADILAITTPWEEFRALRREDWNHSSRVPVILDCWRLLNAPQFQIGFQYLTLGQGAGPQSGRPLLSALAQPVGD